MFGRFLRDKRGNFAMLTGIAMVPLLGGLALAIDYTEVSRQRQETLNALDAAAFAAAQRTLEGASETVIKAYTRDFFDANLGSVDPANVQLTVLLPSNIAGGGKVRLTANLKYNTLFLPPFRALLNGNRKIETAAIDFQATSEVQLKNTLEVALVLDNSGSMAEFGKGSTKQRIALLRDASKELVTSMATQAKTMKQVNKPMQFALVPFSASVNIGPANASQNWMDQDGISPIHHENFDWTATASNMGNRTVQKVNGVYTKKGSDWGSDENKKVTRFTLYNDIKRTCTGTNCVKQPYASWGGCVEARPPPYDVDDTAPTPSNPATLYVPMFAPDESDSGTKYNNWWADNGGSTAASRQTNWTKYFIANNKTIAIGDDGPNYSCTTSAITPLTDVTQDTGLKTITDAIDDMQPTGNTNVPEGMAWGWRTLSSAVPFTEGRSEVLRGNDKVVIVLTDGANTYSATNDSAGNKSTYSAFGFANKYPSGYSMGRIFQGTSSAIVKSDYSSANYSDAMNEHFVKLCDNAKAGNILVMTVALDLNSSNKDELDQINMMRACSSDSRYRRDPSDNSKPAKLFWNATGSNLSTVFKEIGDELSNLRITT